MRQYIILVLLVFAIPMPIRNAVSGPYFDHGDVVRWVNGTETAVSIGFFGLFLWNATAEPGAPPMQEVPTDLIGGNYNKQAYRKMLDLNADGTGVIVAKSETDVYKYTFGTRKLERIIVMGEKDMPTDIAWGDNIYVGTNQSKKLLVYDPVTYEQIDTMEFGSPVWAVDATPKGDLAIGFKDGTLLLRTNQIWQTYRFGSTILDIRWNRDELFFSEGDQIHVLSSDKLENYTVSKDVLNTVLEFAPSDNGTKFAVGDDNGTIVIFNRDGDLLKKLRIPRKYPLLPEKIRSLDWSGNKLIVGKQTSQIPIIDTTTWETVQVLANETDLSKYVLNEPIPPEPVPDFVSFIPILPLSISLAVVVIAKKKRVKAKLKRQT